MPTSWMLAIDSSYIGHNMLLVRYYPPEVDHPCQGKERDSDDWEALLKVVSAF